MEYKRGLLREKFNQSQSRAIAELAFSHNIIFYLQNIQFGTLNEPVGTWRPGNAMRGHQILKWTKVCMVRGCCYCWCCCVASYPRMSVDILGTSWDQCVSTVRYFFTSTETTRLVRTESPGRTPRTPHSSWALMVRGSKVSQHGA